MRSVEIWSDCIWWRVKDSREENKWIEKNSRKYFGILSEIIRLIFGVIICLQRYWKIDFDVDGKFILSGKDDCENRDWKRKFSFEKIS